MMNAATQETMHRDHAEARTEHASWLDDIGRWRAENQWALAVLSSIQGRVLQHDAAIAVHGLEAAAHERHMQGHEHELAQQNAGDEYREQQKLADQHQVLNEKHQRARTTHTRLREKHLKMMAELKKLIEQLSALANSSSGSG